MATYPEQSIMITPGMFEERTVRNVKTHVPNRYGSDEYPDETGIISLEGKKVGVQTAFWGDVLVWELVESGPTCPHCDTCSAPLSFDGMEMTWRCGNCEHERLLVQREQELAAGA